MNSLRFALLSSSTVIALAAVACGGISDPTLGDGRVATVSGALTGVSVPANARVALVFRHPSSTPGVASAVDVVSDVPVVAGKFTMNLATPADLYFTSFEASSQSGGGGGIAPDPTTDNPNASSDASGGALPPSGGSSGQFRTGTKLTPRGGVSGSVITEPLSGAIAGFVVYADANGNGKLDLEGQYASSPDQILGGNKELALIYLKGGGSLDYEKMRDKASILPTAGFNLAWTEGRWLPLSDVELKLSSSAKLPGPVCSSYAYGSSSNVGFSDATPDEAPSSGGGSGSVADASVGTRSDAGGLIDPSIICAPDGRSYTYPGGGCEPSAPPPVGLCASDSYTETACAGSYGGQLLPGQPVPPGWPCVVDGDGDGGVDGGSFDGGSFDASVDGGAADGG